MTIQLQEDFTDREDECEILYTPLDEAVFEIRRRWQDPGLRQAVTSFLSGNIPAFLGDVPKAWLARAVASPNMEFARFMILAAENGLRPIVPELPKDKFVPENPDKHYLAKMYFHAGQGRRGGHKISVAKVIHFHLASGRRFDRIETIWGEPFMEFHHRLVRSLYPSFQCNCEASDWMRQWGPIAIGYTRYFALLTCFAISFENYSLNNHESEFTRAVVLPAFHATVARFGVKPLIVRLMPPESEYDSYWSCYPASLKPIVEASLCGETFGASGENTARDSMAMNGKGLALI